jgi:hypothetical protein
LDVTFVLVALLAAIASARYYVVAVLERERTLARLAAVGFLLFTIAAVVYFWRFW